MFKNLTRKQIIIIVAVAVVVIAVIIFIVVRNKKNKKQKQKELQEAEIKNFVPKPLPKEDVDNYFKNSKKLEVIPEEDLRNESPRVTEAVVKPIQRPAQPAQQPAPQPKQQAAQPAKKEVPFTPIMEEDRELIEEMNKAEQDKRGGGVSIGN